MSTKQKKIGNHVVMPTRLINIADLTLNPENERDYIADSAENVALRQSLASEGVKTLLKVYEDGTVHDGNRRLFNLQILKNEGVEVPGGWDLPAVLVERPANVVEAVFDRLNTNEAAQFSALEQGRAFAKLREAGLNNSDIAKRSPFTSMHVGNMLTLHDASDDLRTAVREGRVSATLVVETIRRHGEDVIREAIAQAFEAGKDRATQRHVDAVVEAKAPKPQAPATPTPAPTPSNPTTDNAPFDGGSDVADAEPSGTPAGSGPAPHDDDVVDADPSDTVSDAAPSAPEVEAEDEVPEPAPSGGNTGGNTGGSDTPAKMTPRALLMTIIPAIKDMHEVLKSGTKAEKAETFASQRDAFDTFLKHAADLGLLKD